MLLKKSADSRLNVDDFLAGIAAAAVVLPQAMAFGVALFTLWVRRRLTELCELDRVTVDTLKDQGESEVVMCLYDVLARAQGRYLRWSAAELHRLAQW